MDLLNMQITSYDQIFAHAAQKQFPVVSIN